MPKVTHEDDPDNANLTPNLLERKKIADINQSAKNRIGNLFLSTSPKTAFFFC